MYKKYCLTFRLFLPFIFNSIAVWPYSLLITSIFYSSLYSTSPFFHGLFLLHWIYMIFKMPLGIWRLYKLFYSILLSLCFKIICDPTLTVITRFNSMFNWFYSSQIFNYPISSLLSSTLYFISISLLKCSKWLFQKEWYKWHILTPCTSNNNVFLLQ